MCVCVLVRELWRLVCHGFMWVSVGIKITVIID